MKIQKIEKQIYKGNVYDLGIDIHHNYFVEDILVHNCYMASNCDTLHYENILEKFNSFFAKMSENEKPFQIAYGGGEPTSHPDFGKLVKATADLDILPNYTTNGMWVDESQEKIDEIMDYTKKYCGGVAISTHPHLKKYWEKATECLLNEEVFTNFHCIISDKKSVDDFVEIYNKYTGRIKYFVLLPLAAQGRSDKSFDPSVWDYMTEKLPSDVTDIAFGANFYPFLKDRKHNFNVSMYTPEAFSKFLDLKDMSVYPSSFQTDKKLTQF
jgi:organic radical activating enzyme